MAITTRLGVCLSILFLLSASSWLLPAESLAAKDEGMHLWGILEWIEMQPYLVQSAAAGGASPVVG